jgi:hypothetical protein
MAERSRNCSLSHDEAAVGAQNLAGHRRRHVGGQVGDGTCGVVGCEPPLERLPVIARTGRITKIR